MTKAEKDYGRWVGVLILTRAVCGAVSVHVAPPPRCVCLTPLQTHLAIFTICNSDIAAAIKSTAGAFKPKYTSRWVEVLCVPCHDQRCLAPSNMRMLCTRSSAGSGGSGHSGIADFKLSHVGNVNLAELRDLHERLEAIACVQLKQVRSVAL